MPLRTPNSKHCVHIVGDCVLRLMCVCVVVLFRCGSCTCSVCTLHVPHSHMSQSSQCMNRHHNSPHRHVMGARWTPWVNIVSQWVLYHFLPIKCWLPDTILSVLGAVEIRGIHHSILEISDMLCFRSRVYLIFVSSPSFSIIEGLFTMYSRIVLRAWRDKRVVCPCSGDMLHFLLGGQVV